MKVIKRIPIFLLSMILCFGMMTGLVFAASSTQDGLEVTLSTDKKTYSQSDQIVATLTVKNIGEDRINNISLENIIPEEYRLSPDSEAKKNAESLEAGESAKLTAIFVSNAISSTNNTDFESNSSTSNAPNVSTGDNSNIAFWIIACVLACGGIIAVVVIKKNFWKKFFSLFLCFTIIGIMSVSIHVPVEAEEYQNKSISASENVKIGDKNVIITGIVKYDISINKDEEQTKPTKPENPTEADEYYWDNSEVIDVIDAQESKDVMTETEVITTLRQRGFVDYPITYDYSIDGEYIDDTETVEGSTDKHPMYQTYYEANNGDIWTIFVINGVVIANPASFNLESELEAQLLFSETKELTSYDDETNKFYVTIPKETAAIVKTVEKIDAETLDKWTIEEIKEL